MLVPIALMIVGIGILSLLGSIAMYIRRTGDWSALARTWATKEELSRTEYILNRGGLAFAIVGFAVFALLTYSGRFN